VQNKVADLKKSFDDAQRKEKVLKDDSSRCERQLVVAKKLLDGLSGESKRWIVKLKNLRADEHNLPGNILIAAAIIAYLGPFTIDYRNKMLTDWLKGLKDLKIPVMTEEFSLERILSDPL
jgi:dynein heavy chain